MCYQFIMNLLWIYYQCIINLLLNSDESWRQVLRMSSQRSPMYTVGGRQRGPSLGIHELWHTDLSCKGVKLGTEISERTFLILHCTKLRWQTPRFGHPFHKQCQKQLKLPTQQAPAANPDPASNISHTKTITNTWQTIDTCIVFSIIVYKHYK